MLRAHVVTVAMRVAGERMLSQAMGCYWTNFAATGDPNQGPSGACYSCVVAVTRMRPCVHFLRSDSTKAAREMDLSVP